MSFGKSSVNQLCDKGTPEQSWDQEKRPTLWVFFFYAPLAPPAKWITFVPCPISTPDWISAVLRIRQAGLAGWWNPMCIYLGGKVLLTQ